MTHSHIEYGYCIERKNARLPQIRQVHGNQVHEIRSLEAEKSMRQNPPDGDGSYTFLPHLTLYVFTADCLPVLLFSEHKQGPVAALHCGWRGALVGIPSVALHHLAEWQDSIHAVLGPAILGCCFEVKEDFVQAFLDAGRPVAPYLEERAGRLYFHLDRFVVEEELKGIPKSQVHTEALRCTACSRPELPSYRRNRGTDPRLCHWIRKTS